MLEITLTQAAIEVIPSLVGGIGDALPELVPAIVGFVTEIFPKSSGLASSWWSSWLLVW